MSKVRYVKVALFQACSTRLQDARVVGQGDDYLLLERAQPKPRSTEAKTRKRRTAKANAGAHIEQAPQQVS